MPTHTESAIYEFDNFRIDSGKRLFSNGGTEPIPLTPKIVDTLLYLVSRQGTVIDKDELMSAIWPDSIVEENNLNKNISVLRRVLGENPGDNRYIVTVAGKGYKFVADVRVTASDKIQETLNNGLREQQKLEFEGALERPTGREVPGIPIDSVAILPFLNANSDPNSDYLADGIPESIINSLSQLPGLKVMSRNSVFRLKGQQTDAQEVGQKLGVRAVLTGNVAQRGEKLAISVELVDVRDNSQIWGQQYNRGLADVFAVQEEIAKEISEKLRLKLTSTERRQLAQRPTENIKAFRYYMQGRAYAQRSTREDMLAANRYFEKAIEEDHNYALAYAGLADAYVSLGARGHIAPIEARRKAEEATRKALAIDEDLAEARAALGYAFTAFAPSDFSRGDRELRRAIELSPSLAVAHLQLGTSLVRQGRLDESLEENLKARELDPLSSIIARQVAAPYYFKRDYARALELLRQANELGPALSTTWEIGVYIQNSLFGEALAELEKAKREVKCDSMLICGTGMVYAARGQRAEALQIIKELEEMSGASKSQAHWIAKVYAALNEKDAALTWLERGLEAGAVGFFYKDEPVWDVIRSDPQFAELLRRMGIPQ